MSSTFVSALGRLPATPHSFSYHSYHPVIGSPQSSTAFHEKSDQQSGRVVKTQPLPPTQLKPTEDAETASMHNKRSQMPIQVQHGMLGRAASIQSSQPPISYMLTNVPRGLEYLASLDRLFVRQKSDLVEVFLGCERKNEYEILDGYGHQVFYATEQSGGCSRHCLNFLRPFEMAIKDGHSDEVIHLSRPLACFPIRLQSIKVYASPPGSFIGCVQQVSHCWPFYEVQDGEGKTLLLIEVPFCTSSCCGNVDFRIFSKDRTVEVGRISKRWAGVTNELFTDADVFGINFPVDLDVRMKAVLLGACMLIDYSFFER